MKNKGNLLDILARPYPTNRFLTLIVTPYGQITLTLLKRYFLGCIYEFFRNPIYIDSPILQDNLTPSKETIRLSDTETLRHTFHHFYFKELRRKRGENFHFPLEFIEQGLLFRDESQKQLTPFSRQSAFTVTDMHIFSKDKSDYIKEISSVIRCIKRFEKDLNINFRVLCHIKSEKLMRVDFLEKLWGDKFERNYESNEETVLALDFNLCLPSGERVELAALELCEVKILGHKRILVDFTIGGAERYIQKIYECNNVLPTWLMPIQLIVLSKNNDIKSTLGILDGVRTMVVSNNKQLQFYKKFLQIPYDGTEDSKLDNIIKRIKNATPKELSNFPYKTVVLANGDRCNFDLFFPSGCDLMA